MAEMPCLAARVSNLAAGPRGCFSPRSHLLTTPVVTFRWAAKTAWLTAALVRMRRMAAGDNFMTGVRQARSNSRMVLLSMAPTRCRSAMLSCSAANASLLYAFAMSHSFQRWGDLKEGFLLHDRRNLIFGVAEVDSCGFPVFLQFIGFDVCQVFLFKTEHQDCASPGLHGDQGSCSSARTFTFPRKPVFEDSASEIGIESPVHGIL